MYELRAHFQWALILLHPYNVFKKLDINHIDHQFLGGSHALNRIFIKENSLENCSFIN